MEPAELHSKGHIGLCGGHKLWAHLAQSRDPKPQSHCCGGFVSNPVLAHLVVRDFMMPTSVHPPPYGWMKTIHISSLSLHIHVNIYLNIYVRVSDSSIANFAGLFFAVPSTTMFMVYSVTSVIVSLFPYFEVHARLH